MYPVECKHCKKYVFKDKFCCRAAYHDRPDNAVLVNIKGTRFNHEETVYVPVFQENFKKDGTPNYSPSFTYSFEYATHDEQMAWSF